MSKKLKSSLALQGVHCAEETLICIYWTGRDKLWQRGHNLVSWARTLWADERLKESERELEWARESQREPKTTRESQSESEKKLRCELNLLWHWSHHCQWHVMFNIVKMVIVVVAVVIVMVLVKGFYPTTQIMGTALASKRCRFKVQSYLHIKQIWLGELFTERNFQFIILICIIVSHQ